MSYFVMVTLDMHGAVKTDYDDLDARLAERGLLKGTLSNADSLVSMPNNTYVGTFTGESAKGVAADVRAWVHDDIRACGKTGRVFALAGGDWAWASRGF